MGRMSRRARDAGPLGLLIRAWLMNLPVEARAFADVMSPVGLDELDSAALIRIDGEHVRPMVQILPFRGYLLASDPPSFRNRGLQPDYVMGVGSSSITLANATVRRPATLALDLGTGSGVQAFLASAHAGHVVGVDVNPRAIALARLNARLSGVENTTFLEGDMLQPVRDQRFDLVVSNPPFVISPTSSYIYRDGGLAGDAMSRRVVRDIPSVMNEGAFAHVICNWAHVRGQDWTQRLREWVDGAGCDVLALRSLTMDPRDYAETWIEHTESDDPEAFSRLLDLWLDSMRSLEIEAISTGLILLRKRAGSTWFAAEDAPESMKGPAGEAIAAMFEARRLLAACDGPAELLKLRLLASPGASLVHDMHWDGRNWCVESITLRLERGVAYEARLDAYLNAVLTRCDGRTPLGDIARDVAKAFDVKFEDFVPALEKPVRMLVERGMLRVAESTQD